MQDIFQLNNCSNGLMQRGYYVSDCTPEIIPAYDCCLISYSNCFPELDGDIEDEDENGNTKPKDLRGQLPCCRTFQKEAGVKKDSVDLCALGPGFAGKRPEEYEYYCKGPYSGKTFTDTLIFHENSYDKGSLIFDQDPDDGSYANKKDLIFDGTSDDGSDTNNKDLIFDESSEDGSGIRTLINILTEERVEYVPGNLDTSYCCKGFGNKTYHIGHFTTWGRHQELCCSNMWYRHGSIKSLKETCCLLPFRRGNESDAFGNQPLCNAGVPCCLQDKGCPECGGYPFDDADGDADAPEIRGTDPNEERFDRRYFVKYDEKKKNCPEEWVNNTNFAKTTGEVYYSGEFRTHNYASYLARIKRNNRRKRRNRKNGK